MPVASTRVVGKASFVQLHNCLVTMVSYIYFLRCQRQYVYLGLVIRDAFSRNCKNFLVTMALYYFFCGAYASTPILGNFAVYHIGIYSYRKSSLDHCSLWKHCGCTLNQPLTSVLCSNIKFVSEPCPNAFPCFPDASDLCSASQ